MKAVLVLILLTVALASGGASLHAQEPGDSPELLLRKFGRPEMSRSTGNREFWFYGDGARVVFEEGKLIEFVPSVGKPMPVKRKVARAAPPPAPEPVQEVKPAPQPALPKPPPPPPPPAPPVAKPKEEPKPEAIAVGPLQIRTLPIGIAALLGYGALVLVLHQRFRADDHKAGATALSALFAITLVVGLASLAWVRRGIGPLELLGATVLIAAFARAWKGSALAFGTYVVLQAVTAAFFVLGAIYLQSWLMAVPALGAIASVAILYSRPVGGFLDRFKVEAEVEVEVAPPPTPLDVSKQ